MGTPRLMVVLYAATGLVVAAVAALSLDSWGVLFAVLAIHFAAAALVIGLVSRIEEEREERARRARSYPRPHAGTS
jgi:membrane protein implicated in regulation of membrane protease activity